MTNFEVDTLVEKARRYRERLGENQLSLQRAANILRAAGDEAGALILEHDIEKIRELLK